MNAPQKLPKKLTAAKHRIQLNDGRELQFHPPFSRAEPLDLKSLIPLECQKLPLEVEIGPGKGEFLAKRAAQFKDRFFLGIDRRKDRIELTHKKLSRIIKPGPSAASAIIESQLNSPVLHNWRVVQHDARSFLVAGLPPLSMLHVYHPDPWPKNRHHKNRFFRSPDAKKWTEALITGAQLRLQTDHRDYFEEIIDILQSWSDIGSIAWISQKTHRMGVPMTHFEGIFLRKEEPVYKAVFVRK